MQPLPDFDFSLPYFAYGFLKPSEPAFEDLKPFIDKAVETSLTGQLVIADGMPLFDLRQGDSVRGYLISFKPDDTKKAYQIIEDFLPASLLEWQIFDDGDKIKVYTAGVKNDIDDYLNRGDILTTQTEWHGSDDPMFNEAMNHIGKFINQEKKHGDLLFQDAQQTEKQDEVNESWHRLFEIQKSYLLLHSVFDRYLFFRYGFGNGSNFTVQDNLFASSELFIDVSAKIVPDEGRIVYGYRQPDSPIMLRPNKPVFVLKYYRQVRHNLIHRGKVAVNDAEILRKSLFEFFSILKSILNHSYGIEITGSG